MTITINFYLDTVQDMIQLCLKLYYIVYLAGPYQKEIIENITRENNASA